MIITLFVIFFAILIVLISLFYITHDLAYVVFAFIVSLFLGLGLVFNGLTVQVGNYISGGITVPIYSQIFGSVMAQSIGVVFLLLSIYIGILLSMAIWGD